MSEVRAPLVSLDAVVRTYPGQVPVEALRPTTLTIAPGEQVSVSGPSGSGKSTLMNVLGLLDLPTAGGYQLRGVDTSSITEAERAGLRARTIGFVFQSFHVLAGRSAAENVQLGLLYLGVPQRERDRRARDVLDRVGLAHRADAEITTLSGGERQRVAIARAVVHEPQLLLADEPTGNLDSATSNAVLDLFDQLHRDGLTQVIVTHDPDVAAHAPRRLRVLDGRVEDSAAPTTTVPT